MKTILIFSLILLHNSIQLFGQSTKTIITYFPNSVQIKEKYIVLKDNKEIRHGIYISYHRINETVYKSLLNKDSLTIKEKGNYSFNHKIGLWNEYYFPSVIKNNVTLGKIKQSGYYFSDLKIGEWTKFSIDGKILRIDTFKFRPIDPILSGFPLHFEEIMSLNPNSECSIVVRYRLSLNCTIEDFEIIKGCGNGLDECLSEGFISNFVLEPKYKCNDSIYTDTVGYKNYSYKYFNKNKQ